MVMADRKKPRVRRVTLSIHEVRDAGLMEHLDSQPPAYHAGMLKELAAMGLAVRLLAQGGAVNVSTGNVKRQPENDAVTSMALKGAIE
jgi:hypothetical protein